MKRINPISWSIKGSYPMYREVLGISGDSSIYGPPTIAEFQGLIVPAKRKIAWTIPIVIKWIISGNYTCYSGLHLRMVCREIIIIAGCSRNQTTILTTINALINNLVRDLRANRWVIYHLDKLCICGVCRIGSLILSFASQIKIAICVKFPI